MPARIAVVEDDDLLRQLVVGMLSERGYEVRAYTLLTPAMDELLERPPQLLISDVELPDGSGLDLVAALREKAGEKVPAIVLSSLSKERDFARGFAAGAVDYLSKPFSRDELLAKCAVHLARAAAAKEPEEEDVPIENGLAFGRYEIERELGRGGYGQVFLALDHGRAKARVALKILSPLDGNQQEARLRFIRETYAASGVVHKRVAALFDVGSGRGRIYYAMEFIPGCSLAARIRDHGALNEGFVKVLAHGLLDALAAVGRAGFVHRDLKPENVILRNEDVGDPMLIDFGLAKRPFDRGITNADMLVGTPAYLPPETIRGQQADHRSDLFSLGLTLRYALAGEELFPELHGVDLLRAIATGPIPPPPAKLTPAFGALLASLCSVDPNARPQTAADALALLSRS